MQHLFVLADIEAAVLFALRNDTNSGFREAPHHAALRAQAEKEAAYRPQGKDVNGDVNGDGAYDAKGEEEDNKGGGGPPAPAPLVLRNSREQGPTTALSRATGGLRGGTAMGAVGHGEDSGGGDGGCPHHSFAVRR